MSETNPLEDAIKRRPIDVHSFRGLVSMVTPRQDGGIVDAQLEAE